MAITYIFLYRFDMFDDLLLLKKGGEVVFFGDLGPCSCKLISYFENLGASPMNKGENPSTWMLNVLGEHITTTNDNGEEEPLDFAQAWNSSPNYQRLKQRLDEIVENRDEKLKIKYDTVYAATRSERNRLMANRLVTIYWRSPAYNLSRMVCMVMSDVSLFNVHTLCDSCLIKADLR